MTNKLAPYKNESVMQKIKEWWKETYPDNKAGAFERPFEIIELYQSFSAFASMSIYSPEWIDPNQFAKCLVAAQITDIGNGTWRMLENWQPKEYEILRARAH